MTPDKTPSDALAPCPFCGAPAHGYAIEPHSHSPAVLRLVPELPDHPGSYVIEGQCACGSGLIGANEAEVVARWNTRWGSPVVAGPDDDINAMGLARYKVVPAHESMFHRFAVVAGDGQQQLYLGRETECQNMARKFAGAFLDGAFYHSRATQPTQAQAGAVPLTDEQIKDLQDDGVFLGTCRQIVRAIEAAHGIKGGQHGTE